MSAHNSALDLGTKPIGSLLRQYALPAIIAMTASSLYNMIDSIFIGHGVGAMAISGLALTFPFMNLSAAFGAMVGVGASALISVRLGQKDYTASGLIFGNVVSLTLILGILFGVISLIFLDPILEFFGASASTLPYAREYMIYILIGNVVTHCYLTSNAVLRAAGHPRKAMNATIFTVIINAILDPLFIYGFSMGIKGAAIATVLAQLIALIWQVNIFRNPKEIVHFERGIYRIKAKIVKDILAIGMSPFLMNATACFVVIIINQALSKYSGDLAIGAYGIINRVCFLFIMIVIGLNQGMQPIAGYNYGAQDYGRLLKVLRYTLIVGVSITTTGFLVGEFMPGLCARAFTTDAALIEIAERGMRIVVCMYPFIGMQMVTTNFYQSIGMAKHSILLSLTRQLIFLVPLLFILPPFMGVDGVWWAMPVSDGLSCLMAAIMLVTRYRKFKKLV